MESKVRKALTAAGFRVGDLQNFLGLSDEETRLVESRVALSRGSRPHPLKGMIEEGKQSMTFRGEVKNGVIVLEPGASLVEGTVVRVEPVLEDSGPTLADRLQKVIGIAEGLPADLAEQHDHYLHGRN
jgi:hypothetical protein